MDLSKKWTSMNTTANGNAPPAAILEFMYVNDGNSVFLIECYIPDPIAHVPWLIRD